jgi:hypothetical protein
MKSMTVQETEKEEANKVRPVQRANRRVQDRRQWKERETFST